MVIRSSSKQAWVCALLLVALVAGTFIVSTALAGPQAKKAGAAKAPAKAAGEQPKFKAIWEPVNVKEDVELYSVHFASEEEGWVAGGAGVMSGGVIYHTKDGGNTWELQIGDPQSSDRAFKDLRFLDATHGFAVQGSQSDHKLYSTSDGQTWVPVGNIAEHRRDFQFTSMTTGFSLQRGAIQMTRDSGKKWQTVYPCRIKTEINGLTRDVDCTFERIFFVSPQVGYAVSLALPERTGSALAKTEDGGMTWTIWIILPGENAAEGALLFTDENTGYLRTREVNLFKTTDGGTTWSGMGGQAPEGRPDFDFAGRDVGWMIAYHKVGFTTDAGKRWSSREIAWPTSANAFCLPTPQRGYVVGEHGMVYRYRIVPVEYSSKGMLAAPMMPMKTP
jgi:photosystem II stability/assembly factor-like uncharacterized protein